MVPLNGSQLSPTSSPAPSSREELSNETTRLTTESESVPTETTTTQEQPPGEELSNESTRLTTESESVPTETTTTQEQLTGEELSNESTRLTTESESVPTETTTTQEQPPGEEDQSDGPEQDQVIFSLFENSSYGVRIQYPSDWQFLEDRNDYDGIIDVVGLVSTFEDRFDTYKERLRVSLDTLPRKNMTLEAYSREVIDDKQQSLQDFDLLDYNTDSNILAGYPAYRLINTRTLDDGRVIKEMETGAIVDDRVYYLTYIAEEEKYADFLPVIHDMINSFEIKLKGLHWRNRDKPYIVTEFCEIVVMS